MKSPLFWDVTQRRMVVSYRRFGTTYRSRLRYKTTNPHRVTPQKSEGLTYMAAQASSHGWIKECFNSTCFLYKLSFYLSATSLVLWCLQWAGRYHCNNPCDVELGKRAVRERERERENLIRLSIIYFNVIFWRANWIGTPSDALFCNTSPASERASERHNSFYRRSSQPRAEYRHVLFSGRR